YDECKRRMGQRKEDRRGRSETERVTSARRNRDRRHRWRPVQRHLIGGNEPGYQVHDVVRITCCRACSDAQFGKAAARTHASSCILPGLDVLRVEIILWNED